MYIPYGEDVMGWVCDVFHGDDVWGHVLGPAAGGAKSLGTGIGVTDISSARQKLNPSRLQEQMFAYTVTNQDIDTFQEIGLPYILRFIESFRSRPGPGHSRNRSSNRNTLDLRTKWFKARRRAVRRATGKARRTENFWSV